MMKLNYQILLILAVFLLGLYFSMHPNKVLETLENQEDHGNNRCPNMLIEKDNSIFLFNSKLAIVPGVNPIQFKNLEEYTEFVEWQKSQNLNCPVLYLQYTTDTQNNELIQIKSSIFENQGGVPKIPSAKDREDAVLDANSDPNSKYNKGMLQGFDQANQNIGLDTPLDKMYYDKSEFSANPMDPNWAGKEYSRTSVESGKFSDRYVYKHTSD